MRVLIADKLADGTVARLEATGSAVTEDPDLSGEALAARIAELDPDVLVVRSTKVQQAHFEAGKALSLVIRAGAGVNTIDLAFASSHGIYVANCPGKNAIAVAELVIGQLVNLDRRISDNVAELRAGRWDKKGFGKAAGIYGRTLAVLGCGNIGVEVIRRAKAMGMKIRAWSRSLSPEQAEALGVTHAASPLEACRGAHAVTVHLAKCAETTGLVDRTILDALAPGAFVINTSRGGIVDEAALLEAMETRGIRAGLDVFEEEPKASDREYPFAIGKHPSVYGTHHIGASTEQAKEAVAAEVVRIVDAYVRLGEVPNCVNLADRSEATHVLTVRHADEVGVLAKVLGILSENGLNVQEMDNIIFQGGGAACASIQLSDRPGPEALRAIEAHPHVFAATVVAL